MSPLDAEDQRKETLKIEAEELLPEVSGPFQPHAVSVDDMWQLQMLETWLTIRSYHDQRHFLEEFPALLHLRNDELIEETLVVERADLPQQLPELRLLFLSPSVVYHYLFFSISIITSFIPFAMLSKAASGFFHSTTGVAS